MRSHKTPRATDSEAVEVKAMFDITQPYLDEVMDQPGETFGLDVFVENTETHSRLLGPDGIPLEYEEIRVGFILRCPQNG